MNKIFKIIIISCIVIFVLSVSGSFIYYYTYFKPHNEEAKWKEELEWEKEKLQNEELKESKEKQQEKLDKALREEALYNCLDDAYRLYIEQWNKECELLDLEPGSSLPKNKADDLEEYWKDLKEDCFKLYGSD